jgi:hypothetical protein
LQQPVGPVLPAAQQGDKAARCDQKAVAYEKKGNLAKAQRNREKAYRIREKYGIAHPVGSLPPGQYQMSTPMMMNQGNATTVPPTI